MIRYLFLNSRFLCHIACLFLLFLIGNDYVLVPIFFLFLVYFLIQKRYANYLVCGVYAICFNSEIVYFLYSFITCVFLLLVKEMPRYSFKGFHKAFIALLVYSLVLYFIQLFNSFSFFSLPFFLVTFFSPICVIYFISVIKINQNEVDYVIRDFIMIGIIQLFFSLVIQGFDTGFGNIINRPTFGDRLKGTTSSSNYLSFLVVSVLLPYFVSFFQSRSNLYQKVFFGILSTMLVLLLYFNDSKLYIVSILVAGSVFLLKYLFSFNFHAKIYLLLSTTLILLIAIYVGFFSRIFDFGLNKYWDYIYGKYNSKVQYYGFVFDASTRSSFDFYFGTGPGTNGSRASNALAYDVLYKKENSFTLPSFVPPISSEFTKRYLSGLYSSEYAEETGYRSAVLGNPFNSLCALFLEFGLFGFTLFIVFFRRFFICLDKSPQSPLQISSFVLAGSCLFMAVFDQTLEIPSAMHFVYLYFGFSLKI